MLMRSLFILCLTLPILAKTSEATAPDGVRLAYDDLGEGSQTLVLIHGWSCNRHFWKEQLDILKQTYRIINLDLGGHGDSAANRQDWTIPKLAGDVKAVIEAAKAKDVILIGHSMGGSVSLAAAAQMKGNVRAVVAIDALHDAEMVIPIEQMNGMKVMMEQNWDNFIAAFIASTFTAGKHPELVEWLTEHASKTNRTAAMNLMQSFVRVDFKALFQNAGVPIRCVNSGDAMPTKTEVNRKYADFDAVIMKDVGHFLMLEQPDNFNEKLIDVLKTL